MINIIAIRQSYKHRELLEIWWITGDSNLANAMTKSTANKSLKLLISTNHLNVKVQGWVQRPKAQGSVNRDREEEKHSH